MNIILDITVRKIINNISLDKIATISIMNIEININLKIVISFITIIYIIVIIVFHSYSKKKIIFT